MSGKRQKTQYSLALESVARGETPVSDHQGAEPFVGKPAPESPALQANPIEPPRYVTRMPGGVGGVAPRGVPLSRSSTQIGRSLYPTTMVGHRPQSRSRLSHTSFK